MNDSDQERYDYIESEWASTIERLNVSEERLIEALTRVEQLEKNQEFHQAIRHLRQDVTELRQLASTHLDTIDKNEETIKLLEAQLAKQGEHDGSSRL